MDGSRTKIKLVLHIMCWELPYLQYYFTQLKKSKYYIPENIDFIIDITFNCSDYFIDWQKSNVSSSFLIDLFKSYLILLDNFQVKYKIINFPLYGHLDAQRDAKQEDIDYYILSTPDIMFDERLLAYYCEAIKQIKNKYFLITPQITQMWDSSWDVLVNPKYKNIPYDKFLDKNCFDIIHDQNNSIEDIKLTPLPGSKFAGWFDLVNKKTYEELIPVWDNWNGYGGWDYYSMIVTDTYKNYGGDFQQYLLEGQTIVEWTHGKVGHELVNPYKEWLTLKKTPNHGEIFKENVIEYAKKRILELGNIK
jgi:hypothetical protein